MMKVYAYKNIPEVIECSSSGGAFSRIVELLTKKWGKNYSIYGAAWTEELKVQHQRSTTKEDVIQFSGSKYIRSNLKGIYVDVAKDLLEHKNVIFSGTPCQVYWLNVYLDKNNIDKSNLVTIDLICHGNPVPKVWEDCKVWFEKKYGSKVVGVTFRDKNIGWKRYPTSIKLEDGRVIRWTYETQIYIRMFLSLLILDECCYSCSFSNTDRVSDITLGDFWGIDKVMPEVPATKGVSLILANTIKGQNIINEMSYLLKKNELLCECFSNTYLNYQHNLRRPTEKPKRYEEFWRDYNESGFDYVIKKYRFIESKGKLKFVIKSILLNLKYFEKRLA